MSLENL